MGPRIATPVAATVVTLRYGHRRLYPIVDRAHPRQIGAQRTEESVTPKHKSVTYVLDHQCYLCPDPRQCYIHP